MFWIAVWISAWVTSLAVAIYVSGMRAYDKGYWDAKESYERVYAQRNEADALKRRQATRHSLYEILKHSESVKGAVEKAINENDG